jgi:T5SS/PEP-CTERM-associated repeat protein
MPSRARERLDVSAGHPLLTGRLDKICGFFRHSLRWNLHAAAFSIVAVMSEILQKVFSSLLTMFEFYSLRRLLRLSVACLVAFLSQPSLAAIQSIGDVSPDPATVTSTVDLILGNTSAGTTQIDGGSSVVSRDGYAGRTAGTYGTAFIGGESSSWTNRQLYIGEYGVGSLYLSDGADVVTNLNAYLGYRFGSTGNSAVDSLGSTWTVNHTLSVGYRGNSKLDITRGGAVSALDITIGDVTGSEGKIVLSLGSSKLTAAGSTIVGGYGKGTLEIYPSAVVDGGYVVVGADNADSRIAFSQGTLNAETLFAAADHLLGYGYITSHGLISDVELVFDQSHPLQQQLLIDRLPGQYISIDLDVDGTGAMGAGVRGNGSLRIADGVVVNSTGGYIGYHSGSNGVATIEGPGSSWNILSQIYIGYRGNGAVHVQNQGKLTIGSANFGANAYVGSEAAGSAALNISSGGSVEVYGDIELAQESGSSGVINLNGGVLQLHGGSILRASSATAAFNFTGGRLEGAGSIDVRVPFVQSGGTLAPGNLVGRTTILRGYTLDSGAIELDINGGSSTLQDSLSVNGQVNLLGANGVAEGVLEVSLGYAPAISSQFSVIQNDNSDAVIGQFANGSAVRALYEDKIYQFSINYAAGSSANDVVLTTQSSIIVGDFNSDGAVDAADYVVWRKLKGSSGAKYFGADGNGNGIVDDADLAQWRSHFDMRSGGGSGAEYESAKIPEPATITFFAILFGALGVKVRQRQFRNCLSK